MTHFVSLYITKHGGIRIIDVEDRSMKHHRWLGTMTIEIAALYAGMHYLPSIEL